MAACSRDAFDSGQAGSDEVGHFLERFAFDDNEQVKAAAHEVNGAYFIETVNAFSNGIKAHLTLGRQVDFDDSGYCIVTEFFPVYEGVVGENDFVLLQVLDVLFHFVFAAF